MEFKQMMDVVLQYFPEATEEDAMPVYEEIMAKAPEVTIEQFKQIFPAVMKEVQAKLGEGRPEVQDTENKMAALEGMRR